jgi:choice-of-anchor A domain-containing protein
MNDIKSILFALTLCVPCVGANCASIDSLNNAAGNTDTTVPAPVPSSVNAKPQHSKTVTGKGSANAADFEVFSLNGINYSHSDFEGRTGAAGNVHFDNFALGAKLQRTSATLLVGGSAILRDGSVYHGGLLAGGTVSALRVDMGGPAVGHAQAGTGLAAVAKSLLADSDCLGALPSDADKSWNNGIILAAIPGLARTVIHLGADELASAYKIVFDVSGGGILVVDVDGQKAALENKELDKIGNGGIIINFQAATSLVITGVAVPGIVLAPRADTVFQSGHIDGRLYVGNLRGNGQVNETGTTSLTYSGCNYTYQP